MQRAHRLRLDADFRRVRAAKRSWAHPLMVLYVAPNDGQTTRVAITVGRRVGGAVVRNRVRRRVREATRLRLREPGLRPGQDLVFIARPPSAQADWAALQGATEDLLRRARLLAPMGRPTGRPAAADGP